MHLVKSAKPVFIVIAIVLTLAMLFGVLTLGKTGNIFKPHNNVAKVTLRNFTPGAQVDYRILSSAGVIAEEQTQVDKQGTLSLPIDKNVFAKNKGKEGIIKYELNVEKPEILQKGKQKATALEESSKPDPAELLNLMLALNPRDGEIDVSIKGLGEFTSVISKKNNQEQQQLSADWGGIFKTTLGDSKDQGQINPDEYNKLQLVFQGAGIQSDLPLDSTGMPLVEVFALTGAILGIAGRDKQTAQWGSPFSMMTEEFSAVMVQQTTMIGMFIDASVQLETQRKLQELQARAHKDYHPSEQMCRIGSYVRSVALAESKVELEKTALNKYLINQYMGVVHSSTAGGPDVYEPLKIQNYIDDYCHTVDNGSAIEAICDAVIGGTTAATLERINKDIDYTRAVETRLTLDINFTDGILENDEEDVLAMARYLYFPTTFNAPKPGALTKDLRPHYESRSFAAQMGVAHNSFINIIGMKASAPEGQPTTTTGVAPPAAPFGTGPANNTPFLTTRPVPTVYAEDSGWAYMKAMLRDEFGLATVDIDKILGERPSYYAQMEVLTKKIYQNPNFYVNLYDKPTNVKRIGAAMDAILLMNQRDRFESLLRREMLTATLIENTLYDKVSEINSGLLEEMQRSQIRQ
ncbi:MAG: hypothetical protein KAJ29_00080 [Alphaproteobacteria bacterium]|nr:hypothetical protein [Alphaproteobacteria bacterium]